MATEDQPAVPARPPLVGDIYQDVQPMVSRPTAESPASAAVPVNAAVAVQAPAPTPAPPPTAPVVAQAPAAPVTQPVTQPGRPPLVGDIYSDVTKPPLVGDIYSDVPKTSSLTLTPPAGQPQDNEHWWNRSVIQSVAGSDVTEEGRKKLSDYLQSQLPKSMRGQYATEFVDEVSKAGPGLVNFLTSPFGLALTAAHMVPATAPGAAVVDVLMGGQQALQALPDIVDAIANRRDPRKAARVLVDIAGAYMGLKGGARIGKALEAMPANLGEGLPLLTGKIPAMASGYKQAFQATAPPPPPLSQRAQDLRAQLEAAIPEDRAAILAQASTPTNLREQAEASIYKTPVVRELYNALMPGARKPVALELGQHMVNEYVGNIKQESNKVRRVTDWINRNVPEDERNITKMGFAMEGDVDEASLSPQAREGLEKIRELNRDRDAMLDEAGVSPNQLMDPETYIRHYWDFTGRPTGAATRQMAQRIMTDLSLQERKVATLKMGMAPVEEGGYGLTPKYTDVTDVVARRHMEAVRAVQNQRFANTLRDLGLIVDPTKSNVRGLSWPPAIEAPALNRAVYAGQGESGEAITRMAPPLVFPDIQMAVNSVFSEPFKGVKWATINQLRSWSKTMGVGYSVFHNNIISEISQAHAGGVWNAETIPRIAKAIAWPLDPEFIRGVRAGIWEIRGRHGMAPDAPVDIRLSTDVVKPWLQATLNFESSESEAAAINAARGLWKNSGPALKALGVVPRALGNIQYLFNNALFNYYLPGQILHSAEHLYTAELNRLGPNATPEATFGLRQEIADHLNRTYGVENWQQMLLTPKAQQAMGVAFLAPMWMTSRLRTLAKGYETTTGSRLSTRYWAGAALTYFLTSQLANYAMSAWYGDPKRYRKGGDYFDDDTQQWKRGGHWTWQNPGLPVEDIAIPGVRAAAGMGSRVSPSIRSHSADIYIGENPDGTQRYIRQNKAFSDAFLMLSNPIETLGGKLSLPLRSAIVAWTGNEPGSGYQVVNPNLTPDQQAQQKWAAAAQAYTPFSAAPLIQQLERWMSPSVFREQGAPGQILGLPVVRGGSFRASADALRNATDTRRPDLVERVRQNVQVNQIPGLQFELKRRYRGQERTRIGPQFRTNEPPAKP